MLKGFLLPLDPIEVAVAMDARKIWGADRYQMAVTVARFNRNAAMWAEQRRQREKSRVHPSDARADFEAVSRAVCAGRE